MLVLSELYYPGWRATVNGSAAPIFRVDGALQGIEVPPGHSHVELTYRPMSAIAGLALTPLTFLAVGALWLKGRGFMGPGLMKRATLPVHSHRDETTD